MKGHSAVLDYLIWVAPPLAVHVKLVLMLSLLHLHDCIEVLLTENRQDIVVYVVYCGMLWYMWYIVVYLVYCGIRGIYGILWYTRF